MKKIGTLKEMFEYLQAGLKVEIWSVYPGGRRTVEIIKKATDDANGEYIKFFDERAMIIGFNCIDYYNKKWEWETVMVKILEYPKIALNEV